MLLFLYWCVDISNISINSLGYIFTAIEGVLISGVLSLFVFIGDSLFSSDLKDHLVGLLFIPRPGNTIFTRIKEKRIKDSRFTIPEAIEKYTDIIQNLPNEKIDRYHYENSQWYKIYSKYTEKGSIKQAQKDYLLCRDLFIETILFVILYIIAVFVFTDRITFSVQFTTMLIFMAVITNIAAHIKMNRFVNNVIATDIANMNKINA